MNPGTGHSLGRTGRERGGGPDLPPGRRRDRELDRRRVPGRGDPGAVVQRAGRLPPHQSRHGRQGAQPARRRRDPLQETRSRDVRRHRRSRAAAQAAPQRVRRPVSPSADGRGAQVGDLRPGDRVHDRWLGGPPMSAVATVRDVTMRFREHTALDRVSTTIEQDAITGLLGRNGAGKTTLMQLLTGHRVPTSGRVEVFGCRPFENDAVLSQMAFVKEGQRYPDHFRVRDALGAAAMLFPNWDDDLAHSLLRDFDLPEKRTIKKLSRGMNSAVGIIIGLASRPPLTLFDEPYLGLDAVARQLFYDRLLADYAEHPRTILLSTHLIEEIADLLEHVLLIDRGRVLLDSDAETLRGSAVTVAGPRQRVEAFGARHDVLHTEFMAGSGRAVVRLRYDDDPAAAGLTWEATPLQELVVSMSLPTTRDGAATRTDLEEVSR